MSKIRIYELAKELGVDNKEVVDKAIELGLPGKMSHSHSLSLEEADQLRRTFIRSAVDAVQVRTVSSSVDTKTGITSTVTERRSGNVIRRRRSEGDVKPAEVAAEPSETPAAVEVLNTETIPAEVVVETAVVAREEATATETSVPAVEVKAVEPVKEKIGPRVLGKIELNLPRRREIPSREQKKVETGPKKLHMLSAPTVFREGGEEEVVASKKKGRVREITVGQLDISSRPRRGKGARDEAAERAADAQKDPNSAAKPAQRKLLKLASSTVSVGELASLMSLKSGQVIGALMKLGVMATINQRIDLDTATIVGDEFNFEVQFAGYDEADMIRIEGIDDSAKLLPRPPVVTIMGHVDHGKTSLLDYIRKSSVAAKEHGGITQHIGAYVVQSKDGRPVTFIDTPGHAAFTAMRARGAKITDIVVLVVAADDGVMPQTIEALNHAKAAGVSIVVALNKMDKPEANPEKVKGQLADKGLQPEDWGGDTICVPVSALTGKGVDALLESILLVAEVKELKANPECRVKGTILEVRQEQGRGTVSTVLVQAGTLKIGDIFVAGAYYGRVRSMQDHTGQSIKEAGPGIPVEINGFSDIPEAGDEFIVMDSEAQAKEVSGHRMQKLKERQQLELAGGPISLEEFAKRASTEKLLELNIIIKADVHGSLEAVRKAVEDLSGKKVLVKVVHAAVGGITESDVQLASASRAIIVGFNVRGEPRALEVAEGINIEIRFYRIIYELIDDVKLAMQGLLPTLREEVNLGRVEVRQTFMVPKVGMVAGCYVTAGAVERGANVRLLRDSIVVYDGKMGTLKRFKEDVREVQSGYECGLSIQGFNDIKTGDVIEVYKFREVQQALE